MGQPGDTAALGRSPFLRSSTGAHHSPAAPTGPLGAPRLESAPSRSAGPGDEPWAAAGGSPACGQARPGRRGSGGGLRSWEGAPPSSRLELARPSSQSPAPRPPPLGRAALASSAPPARPTLARGAGPGLLLPTPVIRTAGGSRGLAPSSKPLPPSPPPRLGSSSRAGAGAGRLGVAWDVGQGTRALRRQRAAGCRPMGTRVRLARPAAPSTGRAVAAAALPGCPSPC